MQQKYTDLGKTRAENKTSSKPDDWYSYVLIAE